MKNQVRRRGLSGLRLALATIGLWAVGVTTAPAQLGLPKVPKLPGQGKSTSPGKQALKGPRPSLTAINPNSAPPGGTGDLSLTGKNFARGMELRINCKGGYPNFDNFRVESPERAVVHAHFPLDMSEGSCEVYLDYILAENGEISPSRQGTPEVTVQVKSVTFSISNSSPMPVNLGEFALVSEEEIKSRDAMATQGQKAMQDAKASQPSREKQAADLKEMTEKYKRGEITLDQLMQATQKYTQAFMSPSAQQNAQNMVKTEQENSRAQQQRKKGALLLVDGSLTFVQENQTLFKEPASAVKEIREVTFPGEDKSHSDVFDIVFGDGKTYSFSPPSAKASEAVADLKKRLGK